MYAGSVAIQSNMPPSPLEIKKKSYLTDAPPSNMPANTVKLYQPRYNIPVMQLMHHSEFDIFKMVSRMVADKFYNPVGAAPNM